MKAKKINAVICSFCIFALLVACTAQSASPEDVVNSYFAAAKAGDSAKMQSLVAADSTNSSASSTSASTENEQLSKLVGQKISGEIVGSAQINGDTATVKVKITAPDMTKIMGTVIAKMLQQAMADALSGKSSTTSSDTNAAMMAAFESELSKTNVATATKEVDVTLVKQNGQWLIKATDDFTDALLGGLLTAMQSLSGSSSSSK